MMFAIESLPTRATRLLLNRSLGGIGFAPPITDESSNISTTVGTTTIALTCATGGACVVGDIDPGGGLVFMMRAQLNHEVTIWMRRVLVGLIARAWQRAPFRKGSFVFQNFDEIRGKMHSCLCDSACSSGTSDRMASTLSGCPG